MKRKNLYRILSMITAAAVVSSYTAVFAEDAVSFDGPLNAQTAVLDAVTDADGEAAAEEIVTEDSADAELTDTDELDAVLASGWCGDDLQWTLDSSGQLLIYGSGPMYSYSGTVTGTHAPWYNYRSAISSIIFSGYDNDNYIPISVGDYAFLDLTELTSVSLFKYISGIGDYAFKNCTSLHTVSMSSSVTDIGMGAFTNCSSLRSISLPESLSRVNAYMFNNCSALQYIYIPDGVSFIDKYAFYNCTALRNVYIPYTVSSVEPYTFANCVSLTSLTLPSSLASIKEYAFSGCRSLDNVTVPDSVYTIENNAFENCYSLTSITLSKNISKIGDYTFSGCSALETLALPENVSNIGTYAFNGCNKLRCISLPSFLSVIGTSAFHNCSVLTHIHIPYNTDWRYYSGRGELPTVSDYYININADGTCPTGVSCPLGMISWGSIITSHPNDFTVIAGSIASFDIAATGTNLTYQWQYSPDGIVWNNCTTAGAHTSSYSFIASLSHDNFRYRCIVADSYGNSYTSDPATLHVLDDISISAQPEAQSAVEGGSAEFSVTAAGTGLIYQWQYSTDGVSWVNIGSASASADSLTVSPLTAAMNGRYYRCVITDAYGNSVNTDAAQLTVISGPKITSQPADVTVNEGTNAVFSVRATGSGLFYQWQYSTDGITWYNSSDTGYSTNTLTVAGTAASMNGRQYRCIVTDSNGLNEVSSTAALTVYALSITYQPSDITVNAGQTAMFTVAASGTVSGYQWQYSADGGVTWISSGASGSNTNTLTIASANTGLNNYLYRCAVTFTGGTRVYSNSARLYVNSFSILSHPSPVSVTAGQPAAFSVGTSGTVSQYRWQYSADGGSTWCNSGATGAKTSTLTIASTNTGLNNYLYRCVVIFSDGTKLFSNSARLLVSGRAAITSQPAAISVNAGQTAAFSVSTSGTVSKFQWQYSANGGSTWCNSGASGAKTNALTIASTNTGLNNYLYRCIVTFSDGTVIYSDSARLTVASGAAIISQPAPLSVIEGQTAAFSVTASGSAVKYQWQYSKDGGTIWHNSGASGAKTSTLTIASTNTGLDNYIYRCIVTFSDGTVLYSVGAKLTVANRAAITSQPSPLSVIAGQTAAFSVTASSGAIKYQWQYSYDGGTVWHNSGASGAKTRTLTIASTNTGLNNYIYRCIVTFSDGTKLYSDGARLFVS